MIYQGDCLDILPTLEANTIQCCVTSPPYYGLRDYGCAGQIGLEGTPDEYVEKLVAVFREVRRVLRDDGTVWLNLGDSYANNSNGSNPSPTSCLGSGPNGASKYRDDCTYATKRVPAGLKPKDLIGIPWRVAFALQADGWYLRQDIIWAKPNPMPESVTDRCTKSHEYIFLLTKSARYYFDQDSIREPHKRIWDATNGGSISTGRMVEAGGAMGDMSSHPKGYPLPNPNGANRRSVWTITTKPFKEAHFATFPEEIPRTCILAGSKKGDTILDPFSGAGTTGVVAEKFDRKYIGIELNPQYTKLAEDRIYNVQPLFAGVNA
jgi:DNA modification methylase